MNGIIQILIVSEHASVRADLRTIFQLAEGITVVGEAVSVGDAITQAQTLQPDLVLVDLEMSGRQGFDSIAQLKALRLGLALVAFTAHDYPAARESAARCGANTIIIKGTGLEEMLQIIRQAGQNSHP
jgi:DNA-binding NarL/FixJ family response regulator